MGEDDLGLGQQLAFEERLGLHDRPLAPQVGERDLVDQLVAGAGDPDCSRQLADELARQQNFRSIARIDAGISPEQFRVLKPGEVWEIAAQAVV